MTKILVTGGAGFIGGNFIKQQIKLGNDIINYDLLTYAGCIDSLKEFNNNNKYKFIKGDICNADLIKKVLYKYKPSKIINFAAESHVDRSIDESKNFINTNIIGTYVLLEESLKYYLKLNSSNKNKFKFLHVSTDEVFGSLGKNGLFNENTPYDPSSPYSASKAASDHLVKAWYRTYDLPILITNCSNNYGPYQFPEKLIPLMIINAVESKPLPIYGNGENIRDWIYVEDHCNGINKVLNNGKIGETYLIGGNNEISNLEVVKDICKTLDQLYPKENGTYFDLITFVKDRPGHDLRYAIDYNKIKNQLGWKPEINFNEGIKKTIIWYLENKDWWLNIKNNNYNQQRLGIYKK